MKFAKDYGNVKGMDDGDDYCGAMDGAGVFTSPKPFVVLGWPEESSVKTFDDEGIARQFIAKAKMQDEFATYARLYGYSGGKWNRL